MNRESLGIFYYHYQGCQSNSRDIEEHSTCMSMPVYSYAFEKAFASTYNGTSTDYTKAT